MTRHRPTTAHSAGRRFALLAAITTAGTLVVAGVPGTAWALVTPSPDPSTAAAPLTASSPSTTPADATASPSDTAAPSASSAAPTPTDTPQPAPTQTVAPAPSAVASSALPGPYANGSPVLRVGVQAYAAGAGGTSPHGGYDTRSDQCATCHRAHTAKSPALLVSAAPQASLCFTCHDGTGALSDVKAYYTDPKVPANDPSTGSYYRHDSLVASTHVLAETNEFGGVSNRHAECSDCHNPHEPAGANSTSSPAGTPWLASGRLAGISGVAVTNGVGGTTPTYTWLDGTTTPIQFEYQLCFKCHSSFTTLPINTSGKPSRDVTDVAKEFNPNNDSFHPVEAQGKNATAKKAASLAGSSPYKLWTFTVDDTVRCTSCHASGTSLGTPAAGDSLAPHTSQYRGILIAPYQDRALRLEGDAYNAADFKLCFLCHTDSPFNGSGSTAATAFNLHNMHVRGIDGNGVLDSASIDTPGAGKGNAICSECHFRTHGTGATANQNLRMVEFAPNIEAFNGTLSWSHSATGGTCTLVCHGQEHDGETYSSGVGG